jgi:hypothetical protein
MTKFIKDNKKRVIYGNDGSPDTIEVNPQSNNIIDKMEREYPEMMKEFRKIQEEQYELFAKKQQAYGKNSILMGGDINKSDERQMALSGVVIRLNDKLQRLLNLVLKNKKSAVDENVEDTFIDIANYANIALVVSRKKWGK